MRLGDLAAQHEPDAGPVLLGGEEGDEQVRQARQAGTLVLDPHFEDRRGTGEARPADADGAAGFEGGVGGVPDEIDQQLLELIAVRFHDHFGAREHLDRQASLDAGDPAHQGSEIDHSPLRRRQAGEPGVGLHEPAQRFGPRRDHVETLPGVLLPVDGTRVARQQAREAPRDRFDRRQRVVHLVPDHADQPLPGLPLLLPQGPAHVGEHQELVRQASLAERAAAHLPASHPARERQVENRRGALAQTLGQPELIGGVPEEALLRLAQQALAGAVHQAQPARAVEGEHHDVDLLHHLAQQGGGLESPETLLTQRRRQRVHLEVELSECIARLRAAGADREVPLPQRGQEVRGDLHRAHHPLARRECAAEPGENDEGRERPADLGGVVSEPQHQERHQTAGQAAHQDHRQQASLVAPMPRRGASRRLHRRTPLTDHAAGGGGRGRSG